MKYADTYEFTSQYEPAVPSAHNAVTISEKIKATFRSFFTPRFDPTRMNKVERCEAGIRECEIDWYNALHGPLVK